MILRRSVRDVMEESSLKIINVFQHAQQDISNIRVSADVKIFYENKLIDSQQHVQWWIVTAYCATAQRNAPNARQDMLQDRNVCHHVQVELMEKMELVYVMRN